MVEQVFRRVLMYRVLKYRVSWFLLSLLGYYLTLSLVLLIAARHEATISGAFTSCQPLSAQDEAAPGYLFSAQSFPGRQLKLNMAAVKPLLPANFCSEQLVDVTYETNTLQGPFIVDRVTLEDTSSNTNSTYTTYTTPAGRDFTTAKLLSLLLWGGGLGTVSTAMLGVALLWRHVGHVLQGAERKNSRTGMVGKKQMPSALPAPFLEQAQEDLRWLEAVPWGADPETDMASAYQRFHRGIGLVRGWQGDEDRLIEGVHLLQHCPPALAETGAAEAILQLSTFDIATCVPEGARAALRHADHAISLASNVVEAHLARIHALTALAPRDAHALRQAQVALKAVQRAAPDHPRLPSAGAAVYFALGHYPLVITQLRRAIKLAPTKEEADALLDQFAQTLARSGDLRRSMSLRAQMAASAAKDHAEVPALTAVHLSGEQD